MTDGEQRWARIEEIFHGATDLSGNELAAYLSDTCAGDAGGTATGAAPATFGTAAATTTVGTE